jgi:hypothetical protein
MESRDAHQYPSQFLNIWEEYLEDRKNQSTGSLNAREMEKFLDTSQTIRRFQITLTKNVRENLEIKKGEGIIIFIEKNGDVIIRKS